MGIYLNLALIIVVIAAAIIFTRYVHGRVDQEFRRLARAEEDREFRSEELARLDRLLAGRPLIPEETAFPADPLPGLASALAALLPPATAALAAALFFLEIQAGARRWLGYSLVLMLLADAWLILAMRRRLGRERLARLLRQRADLRRLDVDLAGSAEDLGESLRLSPRDDSSWAELADDLAALGRLEPALAAITRASELDPHYADYLMAKTSLLLRLKRWDQAGKTLRDWRDLGSGRRAGGASGAGALGDPRLAVYQAALYLAEGKREEIRKRLDKVDWEDPLLDQAGLDPALAEVKKLFPIPER